PPASLAVNRRFPVPRTPGSSAVPLKPLAVGTAPLLRRKWAQNTSTEDHGSVGPDSCSLHAVPALPPQVADAKKLPPAKLGSAICDVRSYGVDGGPHGPSAQAHWKKTPVGYDMTGS